MFEIIKGALGLVIPKEWSVLLYKIAFSHPKSMFEIIKGALGWVIPKEWVNAFSLQNCTQNDGESFPSLAKFGVQEDWLGLVELKWQKFSKGLSGCHP